jgi:hypothetical protein
MNLKKLTIAPMLAFALFAVGCGDDEATCESACEDAKDCEGADAEDKAVDCGEVCGGDVKAQNEKIGCQDEYQAVIDCGTGLDDVCDDAACEDESSKYLSCVVTACTETPEDCQ